MSSRFRAKSPRESAKRTAPRSAVLVDEASLGNQTSNLNMGGTGYVQPPQQIGVTGYVQPPPPTNSGISEISK